MFYPKFEYAIQFLNGEYVENYTSNIIYTTDKINSAARFSYKGAEQFIVSRGWKEIPNIVKVL